LVDTRAEKFVCNSQDDFLGSAVAELALFGGKPAKSKPFPVWPQYDEKERRALEEVLEAAFGGGHRGRRRSPLSVSLLRSMEQSTELR